MKSDPLRPSKIDSCQPFSSIMSHGNIVPRGLLRTGH
jgi:hypothetical protein